MIDPNAREHGEVDAADVCKRAFELIAEKQYGDAEKLLANNMARSEDDASIALFHSVLGVIYKVKGEYKNAWRHYTRAEKLLPEDPALKLISARLLISQFAEYDQALKKAKKVLRLIPKNPAFAHQAYTTMGLAYCGKGNKKKAVSMLEKSCVNDFKNFITAKNIDFELVETLLKKDWGWQSCRGFLDKAFEFAKQSGESYYIKLLQRMLDSFDVEYSETSKVDLPSEAVDDA